jgi:hypothetical protein
MATLEEIEQAEVTELSVRQRVEAFYKGTDAIGHFAQEVIIPVLRGQIALKDHELAVTGTYYRMCLWIQSLVRMNSRIHYQGAASAARSLFELLLDVKLLAGDSDGSMTAKFHAFPTLDRFRVASQVVEYNDAQGDGTIEDTHQRNLVNTAGQKQAIAQLAIQHWGTNKTGKPQRPSHWSGLKIKERAIRLGPRYEQLYVESYPLMSWSVHAGSGGYAGLDADAIESCFGFSHSIAQRCFLEATELTAAVMHIKEAVEGFGDIFEDLRLTPGKVIVKEQARVIDEAREKIKGYQGNIIIP